MVVAKHSGARDGRETASARAASRTSSFDPEVVELVRQLRRRWPKGGRRSLREISAETRGGHLNERGNPFSASAISSDAQGEMKPQPRFGLRPGLTALGDAMHVGRLRRRHLDCSCLTKSKCYHRSARPHGICLSSID
jgi:hypothetical protein